MSYTLTGRNSVFLSQPVMSGRTGRVPVLPYSPGRTGRVPVLPYNVAPTDGLRGLGNSDGSSGGVSYGTLIAIGVVGFFAWMIVNKSKAEAEVRARIAEREGSEGLARYESSKFKSRVGERGLDLVSDWLRPTMRRNRKRRKRSGRRTSQP